MVDLKPGTKVWWLHSYSYKDIADVEVREGIYVGVAGDKRNRHFFVGEEKRAVVKVESNKKPVQVCLGKLDPNGPPTELHYTPIFWTKEEWNENLIKTGESFLYE